ncbi:hypothetical protein [Gordoniibacillus kamchatkensis]|nr:hypothetical protein [Paenibacillus sp. VKM B-2647]
MACRDYLREHMDCTLQELHEATEVPTNLILKFIREGRISTKGAKNFEYPCAMCGKPIKVDTICSSCQDQVKRLRESGSGSAPPAAARPNSSTAFHSHIRRD